MPVDSKATLQKLVAARDVTRLTGTLDELQTHNLQMWGRIAFAPAKFGLNWNGETRTVEYDVQAGPPPPARTVQEHEAYLTAIDTSMKDMLGPEWMLTIKERGVVTFTGPRQQPLLKAPTNLNQVPEHGEMEFDDRKN